MIDLRRVRVGIQIGDDFKLFEGMKITATGAKYINPIQNEATITISGLSQDTRDFIMSEAPRQKHVQKPLKRVTVEIGRQSTGLEVLYVGDIFSVDAGSPPDVTLTIKAKTNNNASFKVVTHTAEPMSTLSEISQEVASQNELSLSFEATEKNIGNFSFSGSAIGMIKRLQLLGGIDVFVDDGRLVVKDSKKPRAGLARVVSVDTGMVGVPRAIDESGELGVEVTFLADTSSDMGGLLQLDSKINKTLNGDYVINQLNFDISSHDDPFFFTAKCSRL